MTEPAPYSITEVLVLSHLFLRCHTYRPYAPPFQVSSSVTPFSLFFLTQADFFRDEPFGRPEPGPHVFLSSPSPPRLRVRASSSRQSPRPLVLVKSSSLAAISQHGLSFLEHKSLLRGARSFFTRMATLRIPLQTFFLILFSPFLFLLRDILHFL